MHQNICSSLRFIQIKVPIKLIGVNKDTVYVGRMQKGTLDYNDLLDKGKEASLKKYINIIKIIKLYQNL